MISMICILFVPGEFSTSEFIVISETMGQDCTNTPSKCREGFTISFWLYYIRGEFVLCAGKYSSYDEGPGIKFTVDEKQKLFVIEISTQKSTWKITSKLIARDWVHVAFKWGMSEGIFPRSLYKPG